MPFSTNPHIHIRLVLLLVCMGLIIAASTWWARTLLTVPNSRIAASKVSTPFQAELEQSNGDTDPQCVPEVVQTMDANEKTVGVDLYAMSSEERVHRFLTMPNPPSRPRDNLNLLTKDDLPLLYQALEDESLENRFDFIAAAIVVLDEPESALNKIIEFVKSGGEGSFYAFCKLETFRLLGLLPPEVSAAFLIDALSDETAIKLLENYRRIPDGLTDEKLRVIVRTTAAKGLLNFRDDTYMAPIRQYYDELKERYPDRLSQYELEMLDVFLGTLASHDLYTEKGQEEAEQLLSQMKEDHYEIMFFIHSYQKPYRDELDVIAERRNSEVIQ